MTTLSMGILYAISILFGVWTHRKQLRRNRAQKKQIEDQKFEIENCRSLIPHKAEDLFNEVPWLRSALSRINGSFAIPSLETLINRRLWRIQFFPTETISIKSRRTYDEYLLNRGHGGNDYETIRCYVQYFVVWNVYEIACNPGDRMIVECWAVALGPYTTDPSDTIEETISKIERHRLECFPDKQICYIAIIRRKGIQTNFGDFTGCDIYEFPDGWQPIAGQSDRIGKCTLKNPSEKGD